MGRQATPIHDWVTPDGLAHRRKEAESLLSSLDEGRAPTYRNTNDSSIIDFESKKRKKYEASASIAKRLGVDVDRVADSTGRIDDILNNRFKSMDQTPLTLTPNQGFFNANLYRFLPGIVMSITGVRNADRIAGRTMVGTFADSEIYQTTGELIASTALYGDGAPSRASSANTNVVKRDNVRFSTAWETDFLQRETAAQIGQYSLETNLQNACYKSLDITRNLVGFYGFSGGGIKDNYGILNDPNLPAYVSFALGGSGNTEWSTKTASEIFNDVNDMFQALLSSSVGEGVDNQTSMVLSVALSSYAQLNTVSESGNNRSAATMIRDTFPNMEIIPVPEFDAAEGGENVVYLTLRNFNDGYSTDDGNIMTQLVTENMRTLAPVNMGEKFSQEIVMSLAGVMVKRPVFVVRYTGA